MPSPQSNEYRVHPLSPVTAAIDARLGELVPADSQQPTLLSQAIRYSLLAPGKRVRPMLALLTTAHCGGDWQAALDPACALEMVHAASLILDDLPSMDNADLRRGLPAVHRKFGEDIAVLAAVALLNQAYAVIAQAPSLAAEVRLELVSRLTFGIGPFGLVAGQSRDLHERSGGGSVELLEDINRQKTGVLFTVAVDIGVQVAGADRTHGAALGLFATALGQAFQARDDLLDRTGSAECLGKNVGQDRQKANLVDLVGEQGVRDAVRRHSERALAALDSCPGRDTALRDYVLSLLGAA